VPPRSWTPPTNEIEAADAGSGRSTHRGPAGELLLPPAHTNMGLHPRA
jgi:hypothetical protein